MADGLTDKQLVGRRAKRDSRVIPMSVCLRPDQVGWLRNETARRTQIRRGRSAMTSSIVREAIDLMIEYAEHAEFLRNKLSLLGAAISVVQGPEPAPAAGSQEPGERGQQSSGNSGRV